MANLSNINNLTPSLLNQTLKTESGIGVCARRYDQIEPVELVLTYHGQANIQETLLLKNLRSCDPELSHLGRHFRKARLALIDLGSCAADLVWREEFGHSSEPLEASTVCDAESQSPLARARDLIKHWPFKLPNLDLTSRNVNVSHKFIRLVQVLESYQSYGDSFRAIIFVQKRIIARLLVALLQSLAPRLQFLRPVALVDHRLSSDCSFMENLHRQFVSGRCNLLVATKAYEDTELPGVPVVLLFDVFESQVSRVYARCRVGDKEGHLIHMVEEGNNAHRHALARSSLDTKMLRWCDTIKHDSFCLVPPGPLRETWDAYVSDSEDDGDTEVILDFVCGDRLQKHQAAAILYRYADRMATSNRVSRDQRFLEYHMSENAGGKEWFCAVRLPGVYIDGHTGSSYPSRCLARREACFAACRQLQHLAELDSSIFPHHNTTSTILNHEDTTRVRMDPGREQPHFPLSPHFWQLSMTQSPFSNFLYPWIVSTVVPGSGPMERASICILTRAPLPHLPPLQLCCFGESIELRFDRAPPVKLDTDQLEQTHRFTVKFCRVIMNKPYESSSWKDLGYLFLPMERQWKPPPQMDHLTLANNVNWNIVSLVSKTWATSLVDLFHLEQDLEDGIVQDRVVEFTHRCEVSRIRNDMTPLSEVDDKPMAYSLSKSTAFATDERLVQGGKTLLEQCHSRRKISEGLQEPNQPILEVTKLPGAVNCLNPRIPFSNEEPHKAIQLLIPEYSYKSTVPASTLRMGYLLPSITRRIDEFLLVKQLNAKIMDYCVKDELLAIATASPLTGNTYDYERLELLGDAFLKYLSSIYVYVQHPHGSEGELHTSRQKYISNQQLCCIVSRLGLPGYIQLKPFNVKSWMPPGMRLAGPQRRYSVAPEPKDPGDNTTSSKSRTAGEPTGDSLMDSNTVKQSKNRKKRQKKNTTSSSIANKTVADVAEAIIGAAYISGGRDAALKATKALTIPFTDIEEWSDFERKDSVPSPCTGRCLEPFVIEAIESIIGHTFQKQQLLALALTHATLNSVEMKNHQRLEFIGDAVLDFFVVRYLYQQNQHASPGDLSVAKSLMVSNSTLAAICVWSGLHRFIHTTQQLGQTIQNYEEALLAQQATVQTGAHEEKIQYWKDLEAPKALSDVVESIIGATLISDGFSQAGVDVLFNNLLLPFYEKYVTPQITCRSSKVTGNQANIAAT